MQVLQSINKVNVPQGFLLTAEECRRSFRLGKRIFTAYIISKSFNAKELRDFSTFLTLIESLEKSLRAKFSLTDQLLPIVFLSLIRVEDLMNNYNSPVADIFKEDLRNLKLTLEKYLKE